MAGGYGRLQSASLKPLALVYRHLDLAYNSIYLDLDIAQRNIKTKNK